MEESSGQFWMMDELLMVGGDEDHQGSSKPKSHVSLYYAG
jgi:hypothetical protein